MDRPRAVTLGALRRFDAWLDGGRPLDDHSAPVLGLTVADATAGGGQLTAGQVRQTGRAAELLERGQVLQDDDQRLRRAVGPDAHARF